MQKQNAAVCAGNARPRDEARQVVDDVKKRLGERGGVLWTDGTPELDGHLVKNAHMLNGSQRNLQSI